MVEWQRIADELRSRPGRWAKVDTVTNTGFATMLDGGRFGDAEPGEFEATCLTNEDGSHDIYVRYVGARPSGC